MVRLDDDRGERRRQRERHDARDHHRDRDGDGELLVQRAGHAAEERDRQEHRQQHQHDRDQRAGDLGHRLLGRLERRELVLGDVHLDVLDHHDRVVDHQPDREDHAEHRQHVDREAEQVHADEGADDRHRHREDRDDGGAQRLQEHEHDQHHQHHRLEEGVHHLVDRVQRELAGVEHDLVVEAGGELRLQLLHACAHRLRRSRPRSRPGCW